MATRDNWKMRIAQAGDEMQRTGRLVVRAPVLMHFVENIIRMLLGAMLAGAEIFGGFAPFGLSLVAASGSGLSGFSSLVGVCFGYLCFQGFAGGLRYVAAAILIFSVSFAFYDVRAYRKTWFMPLVAACMNGITGFVYLSDSGWSPESLIFFGTEILLVAACTHFYRIAFSPWQNKREEAGLTLPQTVSLLILAGTLLITLSKITIFETFSIGRIAGAVIVMIIALQCGVGAGAASGVAVGIGMDLAAGGTPFYSMAYALAGILSSIFRRQGRLAVAVVYVVANGLAVLWSWDGGLRVWLLYEVFIASVLFMLIPQRALRRVGGFLSKEPKHGGSESARAHVSKQLDATAKAFRGLHDTLRTAFSAPINDGDAATVFDRAAERVCKNCPRQTACWQRDYVGTYNALNAALPAMMDRGYGEGSDFPIWFTSKCMKFPALLAASNEELTALRYRRQYKSCLQENRAAVCRQYEELAGVLGTAAAELSRELTADPIRERRLRQHLTAQGITCKTAVFYDEEGHLRAELEGGDYASLRQEGAMDRVSAAIGVAMRVSEEETQRGHMALVQCEPLKVVASVAASQKDGESVSGDTGAWFKREDGMLFVLLCDGMGSGTEAGQESKLAVQLLEQFLRAGVRPENALKTVATALGLRGEETGIFTTVDLLCIDLFTGEAGIYKYGAAPTYLKKGKVVSRITGGSLPVGLVVGDTGAPDVSRFHMEAGDSVLLLSDGVLGAADSDLWLRETFGTFQGDSPKELAAQLLRQSGEQGGTADDKTILLLQIKVRAKEKRQVCHTG